MFTKYTFFTVSFLSYCLLAGCSSVNEVNWFKLPLDSNETSKTKEQRPAGIPKLEVAGQNLGDSQEVSESTEAFVQHVTTLMDAKRFVSASRWIARHPETALDLLRKSGSLTISPQLLTLVAHTHDAQTIQLHSGTSWEALLKARTAAESPLSKYAHARAQFLVLLSEGKVEPARQLALPALAANTQQPLLQIDALQLLGTADLLAEKPHDALTAWQQALPIARRVSNYQAAYLLLIMSDAHRRTGDVQNATRAWLEATQTALSLLQPQHACVDPVLWERIAYLRPVNVPWPESMVMKFSQLEPIPQFTPSEKSAETSFWNCIGRWYLDRGHPQAALVAFKRAESSTTNSVAKQYLRFRQARALVLLNQEGPATAILMPLANDPASPMVRPALALLGSLRLQSGENLQGVNLLRKAVEKTDGVTWLERPDAEADLALALLLIGDESQGLQRLHRAQQQFENSGEHEALALALVNEAAYLNATKRTQEASVLEQRVSELEQ